MSDNENDVPIGSGPSALGGNGGDIPPDIDYTSTGTDQSLTTPDDNFNTVSQFVPIVDDSGDECGIGVGLNKWTSTGGLGSQIYIGLQISPIAYGQIAFDPAISSANWTAAADNTNDGLKTFSLPRLANADGLGGSFQYYFDSAAWSTAFPNGSTDKIVISQRGNVYKGSIAAGNLVVDFKGRLGPAGRNGNGGVPETIDIPRNQTTHGFVVSDVIYNNAGTWTKAQSDLAATVGRFVVVSITDVDNFIMSNIGKQTFTAHGLTLNVDYFLSDATPGAITTTEPSNPSYSNPVLMPLDANTVLITIHERPIQALF